MHVVKGATLREVIGILQPAPGTRALCLMVSQAAVMRLNDDEQQQEVPFLPSEEVGPHRPHAVLDLPVMGDFSRVATLPW